MCQQHEGKDMWPQLVLAGQNKASARITGPDVLAVSSKAAQASTTWMPMFFAVPRMMFMALSILVQFRSGIFCSAISCRQWCLGQASAELF